MKSPRLLTTALLAAVSLSFFAGCGSQPLPFQSNSPNRGLNQLSTPTSSSEGALVPGQIIVKYRQGINAASAQTVSTLSQMGAKKIHALGSPASRMELVQVQAGQSVSMATQKLTQNPMIEFAEPVFTIPFPKVFSDDDADDDNTPVAFPNDPMFGRQYAHRMANSQAGWQITRGDRRIILGIVDSGVDITHPDLKAKIVDTFNGADNNKDVKDFVGHGTHVAGIASAMTNNGLGVAGVAPECGILAVKVSSGSSTSPSTAGIANGIIYAAEHGADVINLSLGSSRQSQAITDAVLYALSKNVVVVAATGNDGGRIKSYPAAVPGVIAVGSTDSSDQRSRFSNYGDWVSVTAPGSDILSTFPFNTNLIGKTEYGSISGTSMATPFVTGLAGLVRSKYPNMPQAMVKRVIEVSAEDKGAPGYDEEYGFGRVSLVSALQRASEFADVDNR